jgi:hypothetical protein
LDAKFHESNVPSLFNNQDLVIVLSIREEFQFLFLIVTLSQSILVTSKFTFLSLKYFCTTLFVIEVSGYLLIQSLIVLFCASIKSLFSLSSIAFFMLFTNSFESTLFALFTFNGMSTVLDTLFLPVYVILNLRAVHSASLIVCFRYPSEENIHFHTYSLNNQLLIEFASSVNT